MIRELEHPVDQLSECAQAILRYDERRNIHKGNADRGVILAHSVGYFRSKKDPSTVIYVRPQDQREWHASGIAQAKNVAELESETMQALMADRAMEVGNV